MKGRDEDGYPLEGVDVVLEHKGKLKLLYSKEDSHAGKIESSLSRLVELLQQGNERAEKLKDSVQYWSHKYHSLYQEHMALKYRDLCERCHTIRDTTPPRDTLTVCLNCSRDRDTAASLTLKLEKKETEIRYCKIAMKHYSNNILRMTEEVMMVPTKDFDQLVQYYKGEITDNGLLNKAGQLFEKNL